MARANIRPTTPSSPAQPSWRFSTDANGFDQIVRVNAAMRALSACIFDGEAENGEENPRIGRSDLACLISVLNDAVDIHIQALSQSMGEA